MRCVQEQQPATECLGECRELPLSSLVELLRERIGPCCRETRVLQGGDDVRVPSQHPGAAEHLVAPHDRPCVAEHFVQRVGIAGHTAGEGFGSFCCGMSAHGTKYSWNG